MSNKLTPLNPTYVMCCQQPIMAVRLLDGPIAAAPHSFCEALQLDRTAQLRRIHRNEYLARHLRSVPIRTKGGVQVVDVLIIKALPRWLSTLQVSRLAPEKQPLARALQQQAEDVLERHFAEEAAREAAPPPDQPAEQQRSHRQMTHKGFERLHQVADALHQVADELDEGYMVAQEKIEAMGEHIVALEVKQKALEERTAGSAAQARKQPAPSDGPRLSKDHLHQAYALAHDERRRSGQRIDALLAELAAAFGVEDMSDIPDAGWDEVAAWFWARQQRR